MGVKVPDLKAVGKTRSRTSAKPFWAAVSSRRMMAAYAELQAMHNAFAVLSKQPTGRSYDRFTFKISLTYAHQNFAINA